MTFKAACIQLTSGTDLQVNLSQAKYFIEQAVAEGAQLIVLPEMFCFMGLEKKDRYKEKLGAGPVQDFLSEQALKNQVWIIGGTQPIESGEKALAASQVYNEQGECVAQYNKIHLFDVKLNTGEIYTESEAITPGSEVIVLPTPFGKLGLAVCYDLRFPELFRQMGKKGAEIIAVPSAFTYTTGVAHWEVLIRARAIENQVYMIAAGQTGIHANGRNTYGHSMIVNPWGKITALLEKETGIVISEIDLNYLQNLRQEFPVLFHQRI